MENPFDLMPTEIILQMCEGWSTDTLLNMSETHSRIYNVCYQEIQKRKLEVEIQKILQLNFFMAASDENSKENIWYDSGFFRQDIVIGDVGSYQEFQILQSQIDTNLLAERYPWLVPEVKIQDQGFAYFKSAVWSRSSMIPDLKIVRNLILRLYNLGYKITAGTIILQKGPESQTEEKEEESNLNGMLENMSLS